MNTHLVTRATSPLAIAITFFCSAAAAQSTATTTAAADTEGGIAMLEAPRAFTHKTMYGLAETVDGWFGDKPFAENGGSVSGYWRINTLWDQGEGFNGNVRFRLRANLPNLKEQAYVFIGQDNEREEVTDQPEAFSRQQLLLRESRRDDQSFFAGLGLSLKRNIDFRIGVRGGLNFYAQTRYRDEWNLSPRDTVFFRQTLFWAVEESLGATTVIDYEHAFSPSLVFRWSNTGTITRRSHGFEWYSGAGPFKTLNDRQMISLEAIVQGETGAVDISNYGLRASLRQTLYKDWLIGTFSVAHLWPKDSEWIDRREAWAIGASFDMKFD